MTSSNARYPVLVWMALAYAVCIPAWAAAKEAASAPASTPATGHASADTIARQVEHALVRVTRADGPGAAVLVARGDEVLYRNARGRAHIELGVPLTSDQVFRIASVTKMFTAAMILKLAEAGELSLDDALGTYIPGLPYAGQVTLRQALDHTGGISDVVKDPQPGFARRDVDMETRIADTRNRPLDFVAGTGWSYSNSGYVLLGVVIEKVTGEPWHTAMRSRLLDPLALKNTFYADSSPLIPGRVAGYTTGNQNRNVSNASFISMTLPASAGALASTVDDLHRWMRALSLGRVIGESSFRQMIQPAPNLGGSDSAYRYGLGMYLWTVRGKTMVGHTGQINGFASFLAWLPESDITLVVLANDDSFDARTFGRRLAGITLGQPYPDVVPVSPTANELTALTGVYGVDPDSRRSVALQNGILYIQRGTRRAVPLQIGAGDRLHFLPDEISYFVPVRSADDRVIRLDYFENGDGPPLALPRVAEISRTTPAR